MVLPAPLNDVDVVELSDAAWELIDPEDDYAAEQRAWAARLPVGWQPVATLEELCAQLEEIVQTLVPPAPAIPLRAVMAVTAFLAVHPDRRDQAVIADALREAFPSGDLPAEVATWLDARRRSPLARRR